MPPTVRRAVRRVRALAALTICVLAVATTVAVIAVGRTIETSRTGLADVETTLSSASELASSTAGVAQRIAELGDGVAEGIGASATALDATRSLATSVNRLIELLAAISSRVRDVSADLATASQQLTDVQAQLRSSEEQVRALLPQLQQSAATLRDLPARLDDAGTSAAETRDALGPIGLLARVGIVAAALVVALLVLVVSESAVLRATAR
jgi:septal ring factor EnvC (AmiA/AmiB activator)